jgi:S-DNA-T family DNA segregation ATPase FtsK/SpoIIIE
MGRPRKEAVEEPPKAPLLPEKTVRGIVAVALVVVAILLILAALGMAGVAGEYAFNGLYFAFGVGYFLIPLLLFFLIWAVVLRERGERKVGPLKAAGALGLFIALLGLIELGLSERGGALGNMVATPLVSALDVYATVVLLLGVAAAAALIMFDAELRMGLLMRLKAVFVTEKTDEVEGDDVPVTEYGADEEEYDDESEEDEEEPSPAPKETEEKEGGLMGGIADGVGALLGMKASAYAQPYTPPPISLLQKDKTKALGGDTKANANIIKRTLQNFGIRVEMDEVIVGPSVTQYAMKPAEGVRLNRIVGLQSNLEMALAAGTIRIEAPIPGKSLVGIEVPNTTKSTVGLAGLISPKEFKESNKPLLIALGKDITGTPHYADIAKMPHGLIAGQTGSGKSVMVHSLIMSLLYRHGPDHLRFVMIDPKRVELPLYNGIPHLIGPVIIDAKQAIVALKQLGREMERRYDILSEHRVRDIASYHQNIVAPALAKYEKNKDDESAAELPDRLPYIVIIIDELADIMQAYPRDLESAIVKLAQKSRAVGLHLILSTQRPEVNVITGLIKANVPTRLALSVRSQIDSRTIIDQPGAEKLLGQGDMLYLSSDISKPRRLQSPFISEDEVKSVVDFIARKNDYIPDAGLVLTPQEGEAGPNAIFSSDLDEGTDELYEQAREIVIRANKASTSYLQRKLSVGYARAAKIIDLLEERGVVGPENGSKPREVLIGGPSETDSMDEE